MPEKDGAAIKKIMKAMLSTVKFTEPQQEHSNNRFQMLGLDFTKIAGWGAYESKRFRYIYTCDEEFIITLSHRLEAVADAYENFFPLEDKSAAEGMKGAVRIFDTR